MRMQPRLVAQRSFKQSTAATGARRKCTNPQHVGLPGRASRDWAGTREASSQWEIRGRGQLFARAYPGSMDHGGPGRGGPGRGGEPGVGSVAAPPRLLDQPRPPAPPQPQGPADAAKACGTGPKVKIWGRAGGAGASANDAGVRARGGAEMHGKLTAGERGTAGRRPFALGRDRDARAAPLRVLGAQRARCCRPDAPAPAFPGPAAWLTPGQRGWAERLWALLAVGW